MGNTSKATTAARPAFLIWQRITQVLKAEGIGGSKAQDLGLVNSFSPGLDAYVSTSIYMF
jgi:hypothetical protein